MYTQGVEYVVESRIIETKKKLCLNSKMILEKKNTDQFESL